MAPAQADAGPVLDRSGDLPLHAQMAAQLRGAILDGRAPAEVAAFFGTGQLLRLERLRHVGGTPLAYVRTWLPAARLPGLSAAQLENASLHAVLQQRYGLQPHSGRNRIRAVAADRVQAGLLDAKPGSPLLMLEGQGLDQHGRPMEWFTTWHRGDQLVFDVDVNDTHESVQPRLRDEPVVPEPGQAAAASGDAEDPLARAQALVQALSAELERLRAAR